MEAIVSAVLGLVAFFLVVGVFLGFQALVALGIQFVALEFWGKHLSFWACFVALLVLSAVCGIVRGGSK